MFQSITTTLGTAAASSRKKKVVLIGAGKIGKKVMEYLFQNSSQFPELEELVVINQHPNMIKGLLMDLLSTYDPPHFKVTSVSDYSSMKEAGAIFVTAGLWPSDELKQRYTSHDQSAGRFVQSICNALLIKGIGQSIGIYAPAASVFVVTNQVDMMTEIMRTELDQTQQVIGIGNLLDTKRFQCVLAQLLFDKKLLPDNGPTHIQAHIVGFHNGDMFLLKDSLHIDGEKPYWNDIQFSQYVKQALKDTITYGGKLSALQKDKRHIDIDSGASILPAKVIADVIHTLTTPGTTLEGSFNICLPERQSQYYGLNSGSAISVPITIDSEGSFDPIVTFEISTEDKESLRKAQQNLAKDREKLNGLLAQQSDIEGVSSLSEREEILAAFCHINGPA